jgi:hypothetical protein
MYMHIYICIRIRKIYILNARRCAARPKPVTYIDEINKNVVDDRSTCVNISRDIKPMR